MYLEFQTAAQWVTEWKTNGRGNVVTDSWELLNLYNILFIVALHHPDISLSYCSNQQSRFGLSTSISPFDVKNTVYIEG